MEIRSGAYCLKCGAEVMMSSPPYWSSLISPKPVWLFCHCQTLKLTDTALAGGYPCQTPSFAPEQTFLKGIGVKSLQQPISPKGK